MLEDSKNKCGSHLVIELSSVRAPLCQREALNVHFYTKS